MNAAKERLIRHPAVRKAMDLFDASIARVDRLQAPSPAAPSTTGAGAGSAPEEDAEGVSDPGPADSG